MILILTTLQVTLQNLNRAYQFGALDTPNTAMERFFNDESTERKCQTTLASYNLPTYLQWYLMKH